MNFDLTGGVTSGSQNYMASSQNTNSGSQNINDLLSGVYSGQSSSQNMQQNNANQYNINLMGGINNSNMNRNIMGGFNPGMGMYPNPNMNQNPYNNAMGFNNQYRSQQQQQPQTQQPQPQPQNNFSDMNKNFNQPNTIDYYLKNNIKPNFINKNVSSLFNLNQDDDEFQEVEEVAPNSSNNNKKGGIKGLDSKLFDLNDIKGSSSGNAGTKKTNYTANQKGGGFDFLY